MSWVLIVDSLAKKNLKKFPAKDYQHIMNVLIELEGNPYSGDIEKMGGEKESWRRRIGSYRIFYELRKEQGVIYVFNIERRTSKTY